MSIAAVLMVSTTLAQTDDSWSKRVAMPVGGSLWGSDVAIENKPCCEPTGRAGEPEGSVLATLVGRASRLGRILRLRLEGGRTLRFVDCEDTSVCDIQNIRVHRLVGWWPARGYYVVAVAGYAEQLAYLVRERDGLMVRTLAPPVVSPHERHAIATDLLMPRGPGTTEVLDLGVDPPAPIPFHTSATCPALLAAGSLPSWIDESRAAFSDAMVSANEPRPKELFLRIESGAAEWVCTY